MRLSHDRLAAESARTGFQPHVLEKVAHLLNLLETLNSHPFLTGKLALKGGTALNLFFFDAPRLSVDIDLNYIGAVERESMLIERPKVEEAIAAVCRRQGFEVRRVPTEHAGGSWLLRYTTSLGQSSSLKIDVNFMYRALLWPVSVMDSHAIGPYQAREVQVLEIHE